MVGIYSIARFYAISGGDGGGSGLDVEDLCKEGCVSFRTCVASIFFAAAFIAWTVIFQRLKPFSPGVSGVILIYKIPAGRGDAILTFRSEFSGKTLR